MSQSSNHNDQTYVYNGVEVCKTGRIAKRNAAQTGSRDTRGMEFLYEIKPHNQQDGSWVLWVKREELFEIFDQRGKHDE